MLLTKASLYKLQIFLWLLFLGSALLIFYFLDSRKEKAYQTHLKLISTRYSHAYNTIYDQYKQLANTIQSGLLSQYKVMEVYEELPHVSAEKKSQLRQKLFLNLQSRFAELQRSANVRQLHFHLKNNESFLRFHRPEKFGDDLTEIRPTIRYVNDNQKAIDGFEEGRIYNGYRFVFPIIHKEKHLGSLEISFGPEAVTSAMMKQYSVLSNFFVKEETARRKVTKEELQKNYEPSVHSSYLFDKRVVAALKKVTRKELSELQPKQEIFNAILRNAETQKPASLYDSDLDAVFTTLPVVNPITGEMVAFLVVRSNTEFFKREQNAFIEIYALSLLALFLFLITFYAQYSKNAVLKADNIKQLQQAANVLESISEGVVVTDTNALIVSVNKAVTTITGYSEQELIGVKTNIWRSDHHDDAFYENMWQTLLEKGCWSGEIWNRHKKGRIYPVRVSITALQDENGAVVNYIFVFNDISVAKNYQKRMENLAQYDQLTGLPNRSLMQDRVNQVIKHAKREDSHFSLMLLDLDNFKEVNDSFGHKYGDLLLVAVAKRLLAEIRESDTIARLGGDEFVILLPDCRNPDQASTVAGRIIKSVSRPYDLQGDSATVSASVGITMYPDDGHTVNDLLRNADTAMYHIKHQNKNNFQFFTEEMHLQITERLDLISQLRQAVEKEDFFICYQPKLNLASGKISGMEALVRWRHAKRGLIPPSDFMPLAEETGLILSIDQFVLREACRKTVFWLDKGFGPLRLSVNISARQFQNKDLISMVERVLHDTGMEACHLELEITESTVMRDVDETIEILWKLREMGVMISIDDFGTGYSSLNYLKRFPLDLLKIDKSFVMDITNDPNDRAVVEAIVSLSQHLKISVVAEGVESEKQLQFLKQEKCHEAQGYFIAKPLEAAAFEEFLQKHREKEAARAYR